MTEQYAYSADGKEDWAADEYEAAEELYPWSYGRITVTIFRANRIAYSHADFINSGDVVEMMQNAAYDEADEFAEAYLDDVKRLAIPRAPLLDQSIE